MSKGDLAAFCKSKRWRRCRNAYMQSRNYICERCGAPAVICHHRDYLNDGNFSDPEVSLNPERLEALCMACHDLEHNSSGATVEGIAFDR